MSGRLTKEQIAEIAQEYVARELQHTAPQAAPRAIVLAGQSGAGKSTLGSDLGEVLERQGGYIRVDADIMRSRLPYADEITRDEANMAPWTQADAGALAQAVQTEAMRNRRNVMIDGTLRDPEQALAMTATLKEAGYRVELHAMAVNEQISFERASMRYESERASGRYGRFVPRDWHDRSYHGMADSVRSLEYRGAVDQVTVYNRLGDAIHQQAPVKGETTAAQTLVRARQQLTTFERINLAERWDEIAESMERRDARSSEWSAVNVALERAHYTLRSSKEAAETYDFDHPDQRFRSQELAEKYGARLEEAYRSNALDLARDMPELTKAFAADAAVRRLASSNSMSPDATERLQRAMTDRIASSLRTGEPLRDVGLKEAEAPSPARSMDLELDH